MPTHYHILVRIRTSQTSEVFKTSEVSSEKEVSRQVSLAMQKFMISYTKAINKRFSRVGSLFQGQFQAKPIKNNPYLLNLCVYIHANPVKDGLVADPADWVYSNYLEWLGQRDGSLVDREFIQEHFCSSAEYQELVMHFVKTRYLPDDLRKYLEAFE
jgi:putative transposase